MTSVSRKSRKAEELNGENACPVCFKDVEIFSIGICDHPICHECSTRMRVLCKEDACPICRQDLTKVAFVKEAKSYQLLPFNLFTVDKATKIYFESLTIQGIFGKLLINVCQICPSKPTYSTLQILKDHLRKEHEMFFCDLCVDNLKIFSQERRAYTRQELALHRRKGDPDNTSHRGHPLCNFCDQRYVDADELFRHLRRDHYFCHFCDADGLNQYYCAYEDLRGHFREAHFLCEEGECKEEKFTRVYRTEIDIRAHKAQIHSQSLGKAAVKQARTLELEFTLAPRCSDSKGRVGRRVGLPPDKKDSNNCNVVEKTKPQLIGHTAPSADIGNPEEFPSLSTCTGSIATKTRMNNSDSLAQKLAKSNRFTVKNISGSKDNDEFPSLVAEGLHPDHQEMKDEKKIVEKPNGSKPPVRVRLTQNDFLLSDGAPMVARVTRVTTSQNIHVQPSRDLRLENFPSLSTTTPANSEESVMKAGWVKKDHNKGKTTMSVKSVPLGRNPPPSVEEYPILASSSYETNETGLWISSKNKFVKSNENKTASIPPNHECSSEQSITRSKKKKTPTKLPNKDPVETNKVSSETKNKVKNMQFGDSKHQSGEIPKTIQIGKTKVDLTSEANAFESKNSIASKITIINNPQSNSKTIENNGAKPKTKGKPINFAEFPALGSLEPTSSSFFDGSQQNTAQITQIEKVAPSKISFTNSKGQHFPLALNNNSNRTFLQPPDFNVRNQQLISTVMDLLCNQQKKIEKFRTISSQFRGGQLDSKEYYMNCLEVMGEDCFSALFPELICLLPDITKQQQLLRVHRSELRLNGGTAAAEPYVICATCGQVLAPSDLKHHLTNHNLETHFPSLQSLGTIDSEAWNKR